MKPAETERDPVLDFPWVRTVDRLMGSQSRSSSLPLTPQHQGGEEPESGSGWEEKYKKIETLGEGACAEVFKALDKHTNDIVAVKVSHESVEELRRLRKEIEALRELTHQNVIKVLDAGDGWYAMPLADGHLTKLAPELSDEERIDVVAQAAMGLSAIHAAKRVHRDVSPNNILRIGDRWVVSDLGFVRNPPGMSSVPKTNGRLGTPGFMAPEVLVYDAHHATLHSDMFSLGQIVVFMTTGKTIPRSGERPKVPNIWESLVEKMTAEKVADRFQSMDALLAALPGVRRQLKAQRRAAWSAGHNAEEGLHQAEVGLHQGELMVLARIIKHTINDFRAHEMRNAMPEDEHRSFNIGLIALEHRNFIEDNHDEEGRPWGHRLTNAARAWLRANPDFHKPFSLPEPETPQAAAQNDDDIPF